MYNISEIHNILKKRLNTQRFEHTLGVEYISVALGMRYDVNIKDAQVAGLLHDYAKSIPNPEKLKLCKKYNIEISDFEKRNPFLLHGKLGAYIAKTEFNIHNQDILNAIFFHTTGRPEMSVLEKIVYIADYIEPARNQAPNLDLIRKLAFENLDEALYLILKDTLIYLKSSGAENNIDLTTQSAYEYYKKQRKV